MAENPLRMAGLGESIELDNNRLRCLVCKQIINGATPIGENAPSPDEGDLSVCAYCGNVAIFDKNCTLRSMTSDEEIEAGKDPRVLAVLQARKCQMN